MKKTFLLLACTALLAASLTACGEGPAEKTDTDTGSSSSDSASAESKLSGTLDEKKDFMFVVTDEKGAAYEFTFDASAKPEGLDDVAEGDSVTVTYKGTVSEADPFDGTVISVEKTKSAQKEHKKPCRDRLSVSPAGVFAFYQGCCSALSRYIR